MARVFVDPDTAQWVHADTGNRIGTWEVRNTEPHASEVKRRAGSAEITPGYGERIAGTTTEAEARRTVDEPEAVPVPPANDFTTVEEQYVEEILAAGNYV